MPEFVIKRDGSKEIYQKEKVINSLKKIGTKEETINFILDHLDKNLPKVITTKKLYQEVFSLLKGEDKHLSLKYNLKNSISLLGPTGYPFEKFFAKILGFYGYKTKTNIFLKGKCLTYETDILAEKDNIIYLIEAKFHQKEYKKNDVKQILYVYGRYLDLKENFKNSLPWLVTNTKFTSEVINFSTCYNIRLTSWNYPENESLFRLIENKKLYPVTILISASKNFLFQLIKNNIILVEDLLKKEERFLMKISGLSEGEIRKILEEAKILIS